MNNTSLNFPFNYANPPLPISSLCLSLDLSLDLSQSRSQSLSLSLDQAVEETIICSVYNATNHIQCVLWR